MKIGSIANSQYSNSHNQNTIYISKNLLEEAKNVNQHPDKTAVIFNNQVIAIDH